MQDKDIIEQLKILDELAWRCACEGDMESLRSHLKKMCEFLEDMPEMEELPLSASRALIEREKGSFVTSYLECFLRHVLSRDYQRAAYYILTRHYVEAFRQVGISDQQIRKRFHQLEPWATDKRRISLFYSAVERAFKPGQYPEFEIVDS